MTGLGPRPSTRKQLRAPKLSSGDLIVLAAPASPPLKLDIIDKAVEKLSSLGFEVQVASNARKRFGFLAGTDTERLSDLNSALRSKKVRAIFCVRGGYGTGRIVSKVKFDALRKSPKIVVGCSDITILHCAFNKLAGVTTFHGPMPQSLVGEECPPFTWSHLLNTLQGKTEALGSICQGFERSENTPYSLKKGRATGVLAGGNLAILCSLLNSPYFPDLRGKILFLEDIGEMPFRVDRCLTQLCDSGKLDNVAGFALGLFKDCEYRPVKPGDPVEYRQLLRDVFFDRLKKFGKPIVVGLPFGHMPYNATLPVGGVATIDGSKADLEIEEFCVI